MLKKSEMEAKVALYPGTFDPLTNGHLDIIRRCVHLFDRTVVGVAKNPTKEPLLSVTERVEILKETTEEFPNIEIGVFEGLTVHYAEKIGANYLLRGLRAVSDFEYELQMAMMNRELNPRIETFFVIPDARYSFLSSSLVKEVYRLGGHIEDFMPEAAIKMLKKKYAK